MFLSNQETMLLITAILAVACSVSLTNGECGRECKAVTDCSNNLVCNLNGRCDDDPTGLVTSPPSCPIPNCKPNSFVYTGPTIDQDHCFTNTTYQTYSCSPPIDTQRNLGILYYFDLVNEGVAKCDKKHYAGTKLVAAMSTGWFNKGKHCYENVTITAGNGRSVVAMVVDECVSTSGCTPELYNYGPCSPKAVSGTQAVWDALGYNASIGIIEITWKFTHFSSDHEKRNKSILVGSSVGAGAGVILVAALAIWIFLKRSKSQTKVFEDKALERSLVPERFKYATLHAATGGFNETSKLGEGGYGPVHMGRLRNGTSVAVKRVGRYSKQGLKQFKAEVMSVGSVHHVNLVKLLGFSTQGPDDDLLLVYEYVSNGSLDRWIFSEEKRLTWRQRASIALDIARGLEYLHSGCTETILHLDIKPQNILIDEKMTAKIADFGFAKLLDKEKTHTITGVRGTHGYMAPEWLNARVTQKTDVYSYGVLLLELIYCRRFEFIPLSQDDMIMRKSMASDQSFDVHEGQRITTIGLQCINEDPDARPPMGLIVKMLEGIDFYSIGIDLPQDFGDSNAKAVSNVQISVSDISPR